MRRVAIIGIKPENLLAKEVEEKNDKDQVYQLASDLLLYINSEKMSGTPGGSGLWARVGIGQASKRDGRASMWDGRASKQDGRATGASKWDGRAIEWDGRKQAGWASERAGRMGAQESDNYFSL